MTTLHSIFGKCPLHPKSTDSILEVHYGHGVDIWNLYTTDAINFLKLDLASQTIYHLALLLTKIFILLTLLRLSTSPAPSPAFRIAAITIVAFSAIYCLTSIFIAIFWVLTNCRGLGCQTRYGEVYR